MSKENNKNLISRPPVVVLLGHVDHGKSSILQKIRDFKIIEKETGGITQHIGAYEIEEDGKKITFIDTPGHEAFSAMRGRGAKVADIAILVVAAEEGVKPQTKEAITFIKKAQIPMLVAINKIDKSNANPERVRRELVQNGILLEGHGGKIPSVELSAQTGKGIPELLELILLVAEMEDLKTDLSSLASAAIIESYLDNQRGPTATLLVSQGILKTGDIIATSSTFGKVKKMENFQGQEIKQGLPSMPVVVLGFREVPRVGDKLKVCSSLEQAQAGLQPIQKVVEARVLPPETKALNLILKTDVLGSIEPLEQVFKNLPQDKIVLRLLKREPGGVNLSDLKLAESGQAAILSFRTKVPASILEIARKKGVKIYSFDLIYDLAEGTRKLMEEALAPEKVRRDLGKLKVLVVFKTDPRRQIVGGKVMEGEIRKGNRLEILRGGEVAGQGKIINLQRDKKDIALGSKNEEIGILYEGEETIQEKDILIAYEVKRGKGRL